jgi:predicted phage replisome organizer
VSEVKWIKITTDMFEHEKLDFILSLPESDAIVIIWIRLLTLAGKVNAAGYVLLTENIPYTEDMLSHKFRKPPSVIKLALETLRRLKMVEFEGEVMRIANWDKYQNTDRLEKIREQDKLRQRNKRDKEKVLLKDVESSGLSRDSAVDVTHTELELDLELEREKIKTSSSGSSMIGNNPFSIYDKQGFGKLDETSAIFVGESIDTYGEDWVRRAMIEAVKQGKKTWSYVENGILKRWKATGHAEPWTLEREEPKQQQRSGGYGGKPQRPRMEVVKDDGPEVTPEQMEEMMKLARELQGA